MLNNKYLIANMVYGFGIKAETGRLKMDTLKANYETKSGSDRANIDRL